MKSIFGRVNWGDLGRGAVVALFMALLVGVYGLISSIVTTGSLPDWSDVFSSLKAIGIMAVLSGLAYLLKNLITNSNGQLFAAEPVKPV